MPQFGKRSKERLDTCHADLQAVMNEAIKYTDFSVLCGHRGREDQEEAFFKGTSKLRWPLSQHNRIPSMACDIAPYPLNWMDVYAFALLAGRVLQVADQMLEQGLIKHKVVSGLDWNRDGKVKDTRFLDAPHFQLEPV